MILRRSDVKDIVIIGGGPSLSGFDFETVRGKAYVLAINNAMLKLPWASGVVSADARWMERYRTELAAFEGDKFMIASDDFPSALRVHGAVYPKRVKEPGISFDPATVHVVGNSGYAAINVAVLLGASRIWLLGLDLTSAGSHWHEGYEWTSAATESVYEYWAQAFDSMTLPLAQAGIDVFNVGLVSRIEAFPKVSFNVFFQEALHV